MMILVRPSKAKRRSKERLLDFSRSYMLQMAPGLL
jgi:hypothetical protein